MAAAAATLLATGCVKNNTESDQTRLVVRLNGASIAPETRAVEDSAAETAPGSKASAVTLTKAWIYVISSEGVYSELMDLGAAQAGGDLIGEEGQLFPSDSRVYVLGNWPASVVPADLDSWDEIEAKTVEIATTTIDYTKPALANATGAPVGVTVSTENENVATVTVEISPLFTRLELWKITGGEHIKSFTVDGVYINSYYPAFNLAGAGAGTQKVYAPGTTEFNGFGDATGWDSSEGTVGDNTMDTHAEAVAEESKVWAYNVGAGSQVGFVIKLSDIVYYPENEEGEYASEATEPEKLLIVNGYTNISSAPFSRGMIYRVKNLEFDYTDLVDEITGVAITANVDVLNWNITDLTPSLGE